MLWCGGLTNGHLPPPFRLEHHSPLASQVIIYQGKLFGLKYPKWGGGGWWGGSWILGVVQNAQIDGKNAEWDGEAIPAGQKVTSCGTGCIYLKKLPMTKSTN